MKSFSSIDDAIGPCGPVKIGIIILFSEKIPINKTNATGERFLVRHFIFTLIFKKLVTFVLQLENDFSYGFRGNIKLIRRKTDAKKTYTFSRFMDLCFFFIDFKFLLSENIPDICVKLFGFFSCVCKYRDIIGITHIQTGMSLQISVKFHEIDIVEKRADRCTRDNRYSFMTEFALLIKLITFNKPVQKTVKIRVVFKNRTQDIQKNILVNRFSVGMNVRFKYIFFPKEIHLAELTEKVPVIFCFAERIKRIRKDIVIAHKDKCHQLQKTLFPERKTVADSAPCRSDFSYSKAPWNRQKIISALEALYIFCAFITQKIRLKKPKLLVIRCGMQFFFSRKAFLTSGSAICSNTYI